MHQTAPPCIITSGARLEARAEKASFQLIQGGLLIMSSPPQQLCTLSHENTFTHKFNYAINSQAAEEKFSRVSVASPRRALLYSVYLIF